MKDSRDVFRARTTITHLGVIAFVLGAWMLGLAAQARAQVCPEGMEFVPGGVTEVVYSGERWGGTVYEEQWVDDFCMDRYEASQPDASKTSAGSWTGTGPIPPAQSRSGVLPWT